MMHSVLLIQRAEANQQFVQHEVSKKVEKQQDAFLEEVQTEYPVL